MRDRCKGDHEEPRLPLKPDTELLLMLLELACSQWSPKAGLHPRWEAKIENRRMLANISCQHVPL